jgi:hypothetical protein
MGEPERASEGSEIGVVQFDTIKHRSVVLRCRAIWRGCTDNRLYYWFVRSWYEIRMVHQGMTNASSVAYEWYITRVLLALEDSLFFSLYSFSCIAKQCTTLRQLRLWSCLGFLHTYFDRLGSCF